LGRVSENGSFTCYENISSPQHAYEGLVNFVRKQDGTWVIFPHGYPFDQPSLGDGVEVQNCDFFDPVAINNNGWFIAANSAVVYDGGSVWRGAAQLTSFGFDYGVDLNDQNQVVVQGGSDGPGEPVAEGYLWENDTTQAFRDTLPFFYQWQVRNIQPFSIGNQAKPAPEPPNQPDPSTDPTIHILADAQGFDVGEYGKTVWTRDKIGKWHYANIALPEGTTIDDWTSVNSSGVIAAIGNGGHALLLVPVGIAPDEQYGEEMTTRPQIPSTDPLLSVKTLNLHLGRT
jgi:hypothetical protein